ncbi:hypothetical protein [Methylomagnum sp.]
MLEFLVIVESSADARTATVLAERVLTEKVDWLDSSLFEYTFRWSGLKPETQHSCWKDIRLIVEYFEKKGFRFPRPLGHDKTPKKADFHTTAKIINVVKALRRKEGRLIEAVLFIRDLDSQPERLEGITEARKPYIGEQTEFQIIIGTADRMREAWVLNGFIPSDQAEQRRLEETSRELGFCPCEDAHRLRSTSDRSRNPKVVLETLTGGEYSREEQCWKATPLEILRTKGKHTGLTHYLSEIEQRLVPIICNPGEN